MVVVDSVNERMFQCSIFYLEIEVILWPFILHIQNSSQFWIMLVCPSPPNTDESKSTVLENNFKCCQNFGSGGYYGSCVGQYSYWFVISLQISALNIATWSGMKMNVQCQFLEDSEWMPAVAQLDLPGVWTVTNALILALRSMSLFVQEVQGLPIEVTF